MPTLSSMPEEIRLMVKLKLLFDDLPIDSDTETALLEATERIINQQIKSVLDELEKSLIHIDEHICRFNDGEQTCDCYKEADDITRAAIQKIRSRYE